MWHHIRNCFCPYFLVGIHKYFFWHVFRSKCIFYDITFHLRENYGEEFLVKKVNFFGSNFFFFLLLVMMLEFVIFYCGQRSWAGGKINEIIFFIQQVMFGIYIFLNILIMPKLEQSILMGEVGLRVEYFSSFPNIKFSSKLTYFLNNGMCLGDGKLYVQNYCWSFQRGN